jgi:hypothetical protein
MYLFAIFSCPKHRERIKSLEETCIPYPAPLGCDIRYIYGGSEQTIACGRDLYLPCKESYKNLLQKTYETIKFTLENNFDYLIKLDSDIHIPSFDNLVTRVKELERNQLGFATSISDRIIADAWTDPENPPESARVWHYSKVDEEDRVPYTGIFPKRWAQGHCYILDRKNCEILASELCKDKYELSSSDAAKPWLYEDMAVTSILFDKGVDLIEIGKVVEHLTIDHEGLTSQEIKDRHKNFTKGS